MFGIKTAFKKVNLPLCASQWYTQDHVLPKLGHPLSQLSPFAQIFNTFWRVEYDDQNSLGFESLWLTFSTSLC